MVKFNFLCQTEHFLFEKYQKYFHKIHKKHQNALDATTKNNITECIKDIEKQSRPC
jgi:hypothetical protein